MKSRYTVLTLAALSGLGAGCMDLKEEPVTGVTASYFESAQGADAAITGAYARLRDFYGQEREVLMTMVGTDSWDKGAELGGNSYWNDYSSQLSPAVGGDIQNQWQNSYEAINAANTAIASISASTGLAESVKNQRLGEARFIRALFYHNLVRTWGAVHLTLEPSAGVVVQASRTPAAEVYTRAILPDLEFAVANLPVAQSIGRASRGAAQTLLAEVLLTRGAQGDLDRARDLTTAVIASGQYRLTPVYRDIFCGPERTQAACDYVAANKTNSEFIFSVQFTGDQVQDRWGNNLHLYWVMAYDLSGAVLAGQPTLARTTEYGRPYRRLRPTSHLLNIWNRATDSRYDATFQTIWRRPNGDTAIYFPGTPTVTKSTKYAVWGQNEYTGVLFPTLKKWLDQSRADPSVTQGRRDRHVWRLADVYLLRAEANIRAGRPADAIADLNVLRRRAAIAGQSNELTATELTAFNANPIDFLLDERERELAGEENRWWVLTRVGRLVPRVQAFNSNGGPNIRAHHALRPIPQTQIDRTEGNATSFPQNPGY